MRTRRVCGCIVLSFWTLLQAQIQLQGLIIEEEGAPVEILPSGSVIAAPDGQDHGKYTPGADADQLTFLNGDTLQGTLKMMQGEGLTWAHPDVKDPIQFSSAHVDEIILKGPFSAGKWENVTRVSLTNGDNYRGKILSMDEETLELETPFGGTISLLASMVASLSPTAKSQFLYQGPNGMEDFVLSQNHGPLGWKYKNNTLYCRGNANEMLGLPLKGFPDMASIEFEMEWKGNLQFYMMFWAEGPKNHNENYTIILQPHYINCSRQSRQHGRQDLGNANLHHRNHQLGVTSVRLLLNREEKDIYLFMNGEMVKKWQDRFDGEITGDAFAFRSVGNTAMKLQNMVIREWDGKLEAARGGKQGEQDVLLLTNGDSFSGKTLSIQENVLRFKTDFAELPIPIDRVNTLTFSPASRAEPRRQAADIQVFFPNEERITLALKEWQQGKLIGSSETTGEVTLKNQFVSRVVMNPYEEREGSDEEDW